MEAASVTGGDRALLARSPLARLPDRALKLGTDALAAGDPGADRLLLRAPDRPGAPGASPRPGVFGFVFENNWNPSAGHFGALPLVVGTLLTSALALIIGVPVAVAAALYTTELCPRPLRTPLTVLVELLAAVPSVVYGLWGIFFLAPKLHPRRAVGRRPAVVRPLHRRRRRHDPELFVAGLVLAIMILPIVSAISREVMATVPSDHKEAALGLGATRWEMIRMAVLPYCRSGIVGGAMLGLGRAIGETIAVTILIGDTQQMAGHLFSQSNSLAAAIANEFGEATGTHRSALFAAGLVLFVLTLLVNGVARFFVVRAGRAAAPPRAEQHSKGGPAVVADVAAGA